MTCDLCGVVAPAWSAVKFCFKHGKSAPETFELIKQAYGDDALSSTRVFEWHKMFKEGREHRVGRPTTTRTDAQVVKVKKLLAPPDFCLFPRMKRELKGYRFDSIEAVQTATTKALNSMP